MSIVQQVREMEQQQEAMQKKLEELRAKAAPHEELLGKIRNAAEKNQLSLRELALDLCPELAKSGKAEAAKQSRKPRAEKTYTNPETNKTVVTKGGNNKTLKEWKDKYGAETVESWAQITG